MHVCASYFLMLATRAKKNLCFAFRVIGMRSTPDQMHWLAARRTSRLVVGTKLTWLFRRLHVDPPLPIQAGVRPVPRPPKPVRSTPTGLSDPEACTQRIERCMFKIVS